MHEIRNRYGLTQDPFTKDVPVEELFEHPGNQGAIKRLKAAVESHSSAVITGEPGTGKTFVLWALEAQLPTSRYRLTYIANSMVNPRDFYRQLSITLGLEPKATPAALFRLISRHLEEMATDHRIHPVIVLDEAQLLPLKVLEHLPILLNFDKDSKPLLSIILTGLPQLRNRLCRNVLASLGARLPIRVQLDALDPPVIREYLEHRMKIAGCSQEVFAEDAVLLMREATGGAPRKLDVLAATALEVACEGRSTIVDAAIIEKAVGQCAEALV